ncbi:serine hydrolase [Wenzhouxiangella sp. AB-CW3]|uniref:serine hydrolase n=1 Tax=Wenzhouxiangella sp. AB-CW3 TaxID=2771012 RepID=UPI00168B0E7D|nr:serine hydrolase [Wenzhouxiangella sp. AB-CW3]QOC23540.1 serine hydrolase [Wenzhouxiangella sp. AB-CW3]
MTITRWTAATLLGLAALTVQADALEGLDNWIENERERWNVPGLAIAVVHEDELVYARGFGRLGLEDGRPVDADTQFGVASLSKAMTATALGILVEEGKLDWDDRVVDHLPEFRLSDDWVTGQVTVRDLLSHRVGVGRLFGNRLTFMPKRSRADFMAHLRHHDFEQPFRQGYVYSNAMYTVAGEVLERVSGESWESFLADRLFAPLGMNRSNTSIHELGDNAALPHQDIDGELVPIERRDWGYSGPAAAVNTSMNDLVRWMRFNLGEPGVLDDETVLDEEVMARIHSPSSLTGFDQDEQSVNAYALGWGIASYRGHHVLRHGGATDGFNSQIWLLPELDLGIVMSANTFTAMRDPVFKHIIDRVAGFEEQDWADEAYADYTERRQEAREAREAVHADRQMGTRPSQDLGAYAGRYHDPLYDSAEVELVDGELTVTFWDDDSQVLTLEHWHHDTFRGHWKNPAQRKKFVWFTLGEDGQPDALKVRFTLRPKLLQEGVYPADYTRVVEFERK